jgi:carboxyl-terminal processing protease
MDLRVTKGLSVLLAVVILSACESILPYRPVPPTVSAVPAVTTSTLAPGDLEMTMSGCSAPPVTFALLCEVVDLLGSNHVQPPDNAALAAAATAAVRNYESTETQDLPRSITCAVPGREFVSFCEAVEKRMETDLVPLLPMVESAVASMLHDTVDPYTMYIPPELSGAMGEDGIIPGLNIVVGALTPAGSPCVRIEPGCPLQVITVLADGPADVAGLESGDLIETVDGRDVHGLSVIEVAGLISGDAGTTLKLEITRDGFPLSVEVVRTDAPTAPITAEMVGNTGYIRLPEFGYDTHLYFHSALRSLIDAGARRLVLDLRDNPGGFLFSVSIIGSEFFGSGLLYRTAGPLESLDYPAVEGGIAHSIPTITLVNASSASAAEILAAVLQERNRSVIVGEPTYGKNLVQVPFELHNGGMFRVTTSRWTTPDGASVEGTGVVPDVLLDLGSELTVSELVDAAVSVGG